MNYNLIEKNDNRYIEHSNDKKQLSTERDAVDLIAACIENNARLLIIQEKALSEDFFNLRTGLAGTVLQKFVNYNIKAALIITNEEKISGRFREMITEANKGNDFRVFKNTADAENWLTT
ncbi:hypothetical protein CLHOM_23890 [Clostridium homopropionicum DSM 5847]|uniref:DUF4180 domain-containing protein n=1 Tax=Clostridium homopropionicum DSM 5847 TaxID=1121318 RepID=A0A0L6Z932_9CLOT|nr:DUF4180 domain-containing protein [Clostridium homopropionicum]KOA19283.1 hypothetical protein CLHOM_23890 [Clostridium homopropionicum DSM 5847]SFG19722.1 protein of unknown function [Clostridium homopropionicum]